MIENCIASEYLETKNIKNTRLIKINLKVVKSSDNSQQLHLKNEAARLNLAEYFRLIRSLLIQPIALITFKIVK